MKQAIKDNFSSDLEAIVMAQFTGMMMRVHMIASCMIYEPVFICIHIQEYLPGTPKAFICHRQHAGLDLGRKNGRE